jgi:DNA-binding NtrC family response regulator/predicted TIM-barrel enzyme
MRGTRLWSRSRTGPGSTVLGVVADSGQMARLAVASGVDFLLGLSAGVYRNRGVNPSAAFLPYGNSNAMTERLVCDEILTAASGVPVIAGLMVSDPVERVENRLDRLAGWGVTGVINYPSIALVDGSLRTLFEAEGATVEAELRMLSQARDRGLMSVGFVGAETGLAGHYAASGIDAIILTPGATHQLDDIPERRDRLQHAIKGLLTALRAVRAVAPDLPCFVFGGPITRPEDLEQVYRQAPFDGFVGGSVFGRYPIEAGVTAAIQRFKSVVAHQDGEGQTGLGPMIGTTLAMRELFRLIQRTASCDLNVCVEGESGVGKELVATHIHRLSRRSHAALVTINCGAIPDTLLESELFGHERGAFTGADHRRMGKFELAHGGTLFLDEVADLSPRGQVALLRAIQQREITRVGSNAAIPVDTRILSASNQPLSSLVAQGRFRADLYYRLNNLTLTVPPLRDRLDDLPLLVEPILKVLGLQMARELVGLTPSFYEKMRSHRWPGNLRELHHVVAQAALLEDGPWLAGRQFRPDLTTATPGIDRPIGEKVESEIRDERRKVIERALAESGGNKSRAAERLGISRKTLYAWLADLDARRS